MYFKLELRFQSHQIVCPQKCSIPPKTTCFAQSYHIKSKNTHKAVVLVLVSKEIVQLLLRQNNCQNASATLLRASNIKKRRENSPARSHMRYLCFSPFYQLSLGKDEMSINLTVEDGAL